MLESFAAWISTWSAAIAAGAAVFLLLLISAFFSMSETALTAASRARLHHLEQRGNRRARIANKLREDKERMIGAILLGNNLVNVLASALTAGVLIAAFGEPGVAYATVLMTVLIVAFGEILPKSYAINSPDRPALRVAPIIRVIVLVLWPITQSLQLLANALLRLFGAHGRPQPLVTAADEIRSSIDLHTVEGRLVKRESDMLGSIFDLADVEVSQVMVHRKNIEMINADQPPVAIVAQVLASRHTRLPLWRNNPENIEGVLHVKDLLAAIIAADYQPERLDVAALAKSPWFVPETITLREQIEAFRTRGAHFALVVDEYGALMGLITMQDILEEIVGDIRDEHSRLVAGVRREPDGSYLVDGAVSIRDLNRHLDWDLPDDEAATIAGLVIHEARVIPDVGQSFVFYGYKFDVLRRQRQQVAALRITPMDLQPSQPPAASTVAKGD